jgi:KAP family P-loop domain
MNLDKSIKNELVNAVRIPEGFDSPVSTEESDDLGRWRFAEEIFSVAVNGPDDWCVRVGIYGEWGTGKTSVLRFIRKMAERDSHIVAWFNPWKHSNRDSLWRAFVLETYVALEKSFGGLVEAGDNRRKDMAKKVASGIKDAIGAIKGIANFTGGESMVAVAGEGLNLLSKYLSFDAEDFDVTKIQQLLNGKRLIVVIDDMDRASAELVPEILYALKEVMDLPFASFICAFDPAVVGEVLRERHRGFGNGEMFLEKIIDYPRWLPPAPLGGLRKLALREAHKYCPFVPSLDLEVSISLLPPNPRVIRKFIRLVALLKPHINRYDQNELRWSVILVSNILKVRYPKIACELLQNRSFWGILQAARYNQRQNDAEQISDLIEKHINKCLEYKCVQMSQEDKLIIADALNRLGSQVDIFEGDDAGALVNRIFFTEVPPLVTRKEFNAFEQSIDWSDLEQSTRSWIEEQARITRYSFREIYSEILKSTIETWQRRQELIEGSLFDENIKIQYSEIDRLFSLVRCLTLEIGDISNCNPSERLLENSQLGWIIDTFVATLKSLALDRRPYVVPVIAELLKEIAVQWRGSLSLLLGKMPAYGPRSFKLPGEEEFKELKDGIMRAVLNRVVDKIIATFKNPAALDEFFVQTETTFQFQCVLTAVDGPLWNDRKSEVLGYFTNADSDDIKQRSAFILLNGIASLFSNANVDSVKNSISQLLRDDDIRSVLWKSATYRRLCPSARERLRGVENLFKHLSLTYSHPKWASVVEV